MTLQPGESTSVKMTFTMKGDMGGPHDFRLHLTTNDPIHQDLVLTVLSNWVE
jgi:hypothetical protein